MTPLRTSLRSVSKNPVEPICGNLADLVPEKIGLDGFERLNHLLSLISAQRLYSNRFKVNGFMTLMSNRISRLKTIIEPMVSGNQRRDRLVML